MSEDENPSDGKRRDFLKSCACGALGTATMIGPIAAGSYMLASPLLKKSDGSAEDGVTVRLAFLADLPVAGVPIDVSVVTEQVDAWNKNQRKVGSVLLMRPAEDKVVAFSSECPHLGCGVEYRANKQDIYCSCHQSSFNLADGSVATAGSPAQRGLDELAVEIRGEGEIWVTFQKFRANIAEKVPVPLS